MAPASVVSDSFVPNVQSSLISRFSSVRPRPVPRFASGSKGESGGKPYVRRTELDVSTSVGSADRPRLGYPRGGLDTARLRFELMTPGTLWIDDLQIRGETTSRSARLNAQRTLLAALQAYREQRYADFARLGGVALDPTINHTAGRPAGPDERRSSLKRPARTKR